MTQPSELRGAILGRGYRLGQGVGDADDALHEATHDRIPGHFRLRLFPLEALSSPQGAVRIHRAIRVASLLRDPHAVQILDFSVSGDTPPFVVLERSDADSLAIVLSTAQSQGQPLSLSRVVDIVESISSALEASHRMGLVHGDLRPALIMVPRTATPPARVAGFGWSKELRQAAVAPATSSYLAPEQHAGSSIPVDEHADQFSLAVIAYEMLSGRLPFSPADVAPQPWTSDVEPVPAPLAGTREDIPAAVDEVLRRAFSFQPARRFRRIREFAAQLAVASRDPAEPMRTVLAPPRALEHLDDSRATIAWQQNEASVDSGASEVPDELPAAPTRPYPKTPADLDDEGLVLGQAAAAPLSASDVDARVELPVDVTVDDGKTQISRSPFFEARLDENLEASSPAHPDHMVDGVSADEREDAPPPRPHRPLSPPTGTPRSVPLAIPGGRLAPADGSPPGNGSNRQRGGARGSEARREGEGTGSIHGGGQAPGARKWMAGAAVVLLVTTGAWWLTRDRSSQANHLPPAASRAKIAAPVLNPLVVPAGAPPPAGAGLAADPQPLPAPPPPSTSPAPRPPGAPEATGSTADAAPAKPAIPSPGGVPGIAPGAPMCLIRIGSSPAAAIWLDGEDTGKRTPLDGYKVPCGVHELVLKRVEQGLEQMDRIEVKRGQPFRRSYSLE